MASIPASRKTRLGLWTALVVVPSLLLASPAFAGGLTLGGLDGGPANDNRADAELIPLPMSSVSGSNVGATLETGEARPCGAIGSTVWYRYPGLPPISTTVDTLGSNYDTAIAIYKEFAGTVTLVACNDDAVGLLSRIVFTPEPGNLYLIQVGGYNSRQGSFTLNVNV